MKINKEYIQTDGSDNTLQYAKKIDPFTWEYREWLDLPDISYSIEHKLKHWDSAEWREDIICLTDYSEEVIESAVSTFGYSVSFYGSVLKLEQSGFTFSVEDSIQLACECIFELEL